MTEVERTDDGRFVVVDGRFVVVDGRPGAAR
jgi:hypothetical protein